MSIIDEYQVAKTLLDAAKARFAAAESAIIDHVGHKDEGSTTVEIAGYKVTTTGKLTRSLDASAVDTMDDICPTGYLNRLFKYKPSLDLKELRYLELKEPEIYRAVCERAITTKPAKTALSVKKIEDK